MTAQLAIETNIPQSGLRPLDPRRDLSQVADLIEEAFAGELDPGGQAALRDMRAMARMGPLVSLVARSDPSLEDVIGGFVWVEDERVVGNVTVQRVDPYGSRWQIANVAVTGPYQGRGIARALVEAALRRIRERGGVWALLQVREGNDIARGLYERLGFSPVTQDVSLRLERVTGDMAELPLPGLRPYQPAEWKAVYELAAAARAPLAQWWRPVRSPHYYQGPESRLAERLWELLGRERVRRWVLPGQNGLVAWLEVKARRWAGVHRLAFSVHPQSRGQVEPALVAFALAFLAPYPRWPVLVDHQGEHVELIQALHRAGFHTRRNLVAMRRRADSSRSD